MPTASARYFGLIVSVGVIALLAAVLVSRFAGIAAADPEGELISQVKRLEKDGLTLEIPGAPEPLVSSEVRYDRFSIWYEPGADRAWAACTLELRGKLGGIEVGAVTVEKIPFVRDGRSWIAERGYAPQLQAVLTALVRRRNALAKLDPEQLSALLEPNARDAGAPLDRDPDLRFLSAIRDRRYDVKAWYLRAEREDATVTEDFRLQGALPDRPVDQQASRRLTLKRTGSEFLFSPGLM